jgi:microcystin-dependent protein
MGGASADRLTDQSGGLDGDTLGASGGAETHTLTVDELAAHNHTVTGVLNLTNADDAGATGASAEYNVRGNLISTYTPSLASSGGGQAHNNVQPTLILNYMIAE